MNDVLHPDDCRNASNCDTCGKPAVTFAFDVIRVPNHESGFWETRPYGGTKAGCELHPVKSETHYAPRTISGDTTGMTGEQLTRARKFADRQRKGGPARTPLPVTLTDSDKRFSERRAIDTRMMAAMLRPNHVIMVRPEKSKNQEFEFKKEDWS